MSVTSPDTEGGTPDVNEVLREPLKLAIFDVSSASVEAARDFADRRTADALSDPNLGKFRGTIKRIWHTEFERFYREKGTADGLEKILETGNIYEQEDGNLSSEDAARALIERVTSEYEGAVSQGEKAMKIDSTPEGEALKDGIWQLINDAITDNQSQESFEEFAKTHIKSMCDKYPDMFGEGVMYAHNLWDIKQTVQFATEHGDSIDRIRSEAEIHVGEANMGVNTEVHTSKVDRTLDKLRGHDDFNVVGLGVVKAATVATSAAATVGVFKTISSKGAGTAAAITGAIGLVAGARGFAREWRRTAIDRKRDMREAAAGKEEAYPDLDSFDTSTRKGKRKKRRAQKAIDRREAIKATRYEMVSAVDQRDTLMSYVDTENDTLAIDNAEDYDKAIVELALAKVAADMSNVQNIDLIKYSALDKVDRERWDLLLARSELAAKLEENYDRFHPDDPDNPDANTTFSNALEAQIAYFEAYGTAGVKAQDKAFRNLRWKSSLLAGFKSTIAGVTLGATLQEVAAHAQDGMNVTLTGEVDAFGESSSVEPGDSETFLRGMNDFGGDGDGLVEAGGDGLVSVEADGSSEGLMNSVESDATPQSDIMLQPPEVGSQTTMGVGESSLTRVELPAGFNLQEIHSTPGIDDYNVVTEVDGVNTVVGRIELDENGQITSESLESLTAIGVVDSVESVSSGLSGDISTVELGNNQFVNIPEEYNANPIGEGRFELVDAQGENLGEVQLDAEGNIVQSTVDEGNIVIDVETDSIDGGEEAVAMSVAEYLDTHDTTSVSRELWFGGDTQIADRWELQLHAGGVDGGWHTESGDVAINGTGLLNSEVFQGGETANVAELVESGNLKAAVTVGEGYQSEVYVYDFAIDDQGELVALIDSNDGISSLFGQTESGQRSFEGAYIEIYEMTGEQTESGAEQVRVLSTFVGENSADSLTEVLPVSIDVTTVNISVPEAGLEQHTLTFGEIATDAGETAANVAGEAADVAAEVADAVDEASEVAADQAQAVASETAATAESADRAVNPIFTQPPLYTRGGMARMSNAERAEHGNEGGAEVARERWSDRSPRLIENPKAKLELGEESAWYRTRLEQKKGTPYVEELENKLENDTYGAEFINRDSEAIITIPLNAVEHADDIYEMLSLYEQQSNGSKPKQAPVVFLQLEWSEADITDPTKRAKIDKARDEIQRLYNNTDIKLTVLEKQWPDLAVASESFETESRQHMIDSLLLQINKQVNAGELDSSDDLLVIAQSANVVGIQKTFVQKLLKASRDKPNADVLIGQSRQVTENYNDYPGLNALTNLRSVLELLSTQSSNDNVSTTNTTATAVKASTLAAVGGIGFSDEVDAGEELGFRINAARDTRNPDPENIYEAVTGLVEIPSGDEAGEFDNGKPIQFALGANIETDDPDYVQDYLAAGKVVVAGQTFEAEDLSNNEGAEQVFGRYEHAVSEMLTKQFRHPGEAIVALGVTLGTVNGDGNQIFELEWVDGVANFQLTQAGKNRLRKGLQGKINKDRRRQIQGSNRTTLRRAA